MPISCGYLRSVPGMLPDSGCHYDKHRNSTAGIGNVMRIWGESLRREFTKQRPWFDLQRRLFMTRLGDIYPPPWQEGTDSNLQTQNLKLTTESIQSSSLKTLASITNVSVSTDSPQQKLTRISWRTLQLGRIMDLQSGEICLIR